MPRPLRVHDPGSYRHVTARGNDRTAIFRDDDDRRRFLGILADITHGQPWRCLGYCLLGTHYHLLLQEREQPLAKPMHLLHSRYVRWFNRRHDHRGHVFSGRYRVAAISSNAHLLSAVRYLAHNPVEAGLCASPLDWQWGSYAALAGERRAPSFLSSAHALALFDPNPARARRVLRDFVERVPGTGVPGTGPFEAQPGCEASLNSRNSPVTR